MNLVGTFFCLFTYYVTWLVRWQSNFFYFLGRQADGIRGELSLAACQVGVFHPFSFECFHPLWSEELAVNYLVLMPRGHC